jgi:hypothetical protein
MEMQKRAARQDGNGKEERRGRMATEKKRGESSWELLGRREGCRFC